MLHADAPRLADRRGSALLLLALLASLPAGCGGDRPERAAQPETPRTALDERAPEEQELLMETVLYVLADGFAVAEPAEGAEASLRLSRDERYRIADRAPGWYRLETEWPDLSAWVPASAVRTAQELAPPDVINERLAE
jgi:hypothetical protein